MTVRFKIEDVEDYPDGDLLSVTGAVLEGVLQSGDVLQDLGSSNEMTVVSLIFPTSRNKDGGTVTILVRKDHGAAFNPGTVLEGKAAD